MEMKKKKAAAWLIVMSLVGGLAWFMWQQSMYVQNERLKYERCIEFIDEHRGEWGGNHILRERRDRLCAPMDTTWDQMDFPRAQAWHVRKADFLACVSKELGNEVELRSQGEWRLNLGEKPSVVAQTICRDSNLEQWAQFGIYPQLKRMDATIPQLTAQDRQRAFNLCVEKLTPRLLPGFKDEAPEKCRKMIQSLRLSGA
jgi:hypothetical protein